MRRLVESNMDGGALTTRWRGQAGAAVAALAVFGLGLAAGGCAAEAAVAESSTELVVVIPGSDIPSPRVDPTQVYLSNRQISTLVTVGAMPPLLEAVARRVDGIIDNKPANGRFSVDELVRMEQPQYFATLFPDEQVEFPRLWPLLLAPGGAPVSIPGTDGLDLRAVDRSTSPGSLSVPGFLVISTLSGAWQDPARRLQLVEDFDGDETTVGSVDIDAAIAAPGRFTDADIAVFQLIRNEFRVRATSPADARAEVPVPGVETTTLGTLGPISFQATTSTSYTESRFSLDNSVVSSCSWSVSMIGSRTITASIVIPVDGRVVLLQDTGTESILGFGSASTTEGSYVVELWQGGQRTFSTQANLGRISSATQTVQLPHWDHTLVSGTQILNRNLASSVFSSGTNPSYQVSYSFNVAVVPPPSSAASSAGPGLVATPNVGTPGRYTFNVATVGQVTIDLYPQGAVFVLFNGSVTRLSPGCVISSTAKKRFFGGAGGFFFRYNPFLRELSVERNGVNVQKVVLDPAARTG